MPLLFSSRISPGVVTVGPEVELFAPVGELTVGTGCSISMTNRTTKTGRQRDAPSSSKWVAKDENELRACARAPNSNRVARKRRSSRKGGGKGRYMYLLIKETKTHENRQRLAQAGPAIGEVV